MDDYPMDDYEPEYPADDYEPEYPADDYEPEYEPEYPETHDDHMHDYPEYPVDYE